MEVFNNRRVMRAPLNPLDKSTVVSIYPKDLVEIKPTLLPGKFVIPRGTYEKPAVLVISTCSWFREVNENEPLLEIPQSSIVVADSIVKDYCNGLLGYVAGEKMPGLFFVPGEHDSTAILKNNKAELDKAKTRQTAYFEALIRIADALWARTNGNPIAISDEARLAARELGRDKGWMQDFKQLEMKNCPACGVLRADTYPVCSNCKTVLDKKKFADLGLSVAV